MPIYEFQCFWCDNVAIREEIMPVEDRAVPCCSKCGGQMTKVFSVSHLHLWTPGLYDVGGKRKEWIETKKEFEEKIKKRGLVWHGSYGGDVDTSTGKVR